MRKRKIIGYLGVLLSLAVTFFSPFAEPLKRWFFNQYDLRYYVDHDVPSRNQTVGLYNAGDSSPLTVRIQFDIKSDSPGALSDFEFGSFSEPRKSFFETLLTTKVLVDSAEANPNEVLKILDQHSMHQTLYDLDEAVDKVLAARLDTALPKGSADPALSKAITELKTGGRYNNWHNAWMQKCRAPKLQRPSETACDRVEKILQAGELFRHEVRTEGKKNWQAETGVEFTAQGSDMSLTGPTYFDVPLKERESGFLKITYGPGSLNFSKPTISCLPKMNITEVEEASHLDASWLWINWKYKTARTIISGLVLLFALILAYWLKRPLSLLSPLKLFNFAIPTRDPDSWEMLYKQYRYFVMEEFRYFKTVFGKNNLQRDSEELLDVMRRSLLKKYELDRKKFESEEQLNLFVRNQIKFYVLQS